jgi:adenylate cyclase
MAEERVQRHLAAILAADVVGYSRLMGLDETGTLERLKALRRDLFAPTIAEFHGRIFKLAGDGAFAEFGSATDAVSSAVAVQRALAERNAGSPDDRRIELRIGISLGDVIVEGSDLYGNGVNVAARMEGLAEPGGICISGNVYEHVRTDASVGFEDLGEQQVKNIDRPVHAWRVRTEAKDDAPRPPALPLPDKPSIAVLPFTNMSGDPEQEYFADGLVEDITTGLSRFKWLFVIARNSTFIYKGRPFDIKQVGRELGVRYVLEGSVRKGAGRVRITTQLVEAESRTQIWAERYDRAIDDIFELQDDITTSTVAAIEPSLRQAEIERARRKRSENLDAYDLVLRAMSFSNSGMPDGASQAMPLLERALKLDPNYAVAHGQIAYCHEVLYLRAGRREENRLAAIHYGHAAISLGPDDATALIYGGIAIGLVEHNLPLSLNSFEMALAISPSAASAYLWGALILGWGAEAERAIEWGNRGIRLSPFDPWVTAAYHGIGLGHFVRARYAESVAALQAAIRSKPGFSISHFLLAASLVKLDRLEEARAAAARGLQLQPNYSSRGQCAAIGAVPELAAPLIEAMQAAGLPE